MTGYLLSIPSASLKRAATLVGWIALLTVSPAVLAQSSSDAPTSAEAENPPRWKFDAGVSISPLFVAFFDEPSCCTPLGGWVTVGSGRFRLQVDYVRNVQRWDGFTDSYEHLGGQEIVVARAFGGARRFTRPLCTISSVDQIGHSGAHGNPKESGHSPIISTNPSSRTLPDRFRSSSP